MEPTISTFAQYMYPTAIYASSARQRSTSPDDSSQSGLNLILNPRIEDLHPNGTIAWQIDGGEFDSAQFFAIPNFARGRTPIRADTFIPESDNHPPFLRDKLQSNSSMLLESTHVGSSALSQHIVNALNVWSNSLANFEEMYMNLPFGSQIIIENICNDVRLMRVHLVPIYELEQQLMSTKTLQTLWGLSLDRGPEVLDISNLKLVRQPFPTITLVHITGRGEKIFVFKSMPDDIKYFYHELRILLMMDSHPNIIPRPYYVITKRCGFGGKSGVCGFVLDYHHSGTLRDRLCRQHHASIKAADQFRWAKQLTSALIHIHQTSPGFFSNLKLNNIVMALEENSLQAMLIDFEQRLGPASWSPPEVHYIGYLCHLASFSPSLSDRSRYVCLVQSYIPNWKPLNKKSQYQNPKDGYCDPWPVFTPEEREAAQVFMLGKLLWCIFERTSSINTIITRDTFREEECEHSFPEFRLSPPKLQDCIRRCTAGAAEWRGRHAGLVRKENKIFPRGRTVDDNNPVSAREVEEAAKTWWMEEIRTAERYIEACVRQRKGAATSEDELILGFALQRPKLKEVLTILKECEDGDGPSILISAKPSLASPSPSSALVP